MSHKVYYVSHDPKEDADEMADDILLYEFLVAYDG